jgi:protein SDA1
MRTYLISTIQSDIKRANSKTKNHKLNRLVQGLLFDLVERSADAAASGTGLKGKKAISAAQTGRSRDAMMAINLASTLWRKGVWRDAKTVALVASACFHPDTKVQSAAIHFFLAPPGTEGTGGDDSDDEAEAAPNLAKVQHAQKVSKKSKSNSRKLEAVKRKRKRVESQAAKDADAGTANFAALHLLHDPQGFVDKLYTSLAAHDKAWTIEHRVLVMRLLARLAGLHRLDVSAFYGYVVKYLTPHQLHITAILLSVAEATHELTPPDDDVLVPVVRKIAHEFVHPGVASEVVAAGINAITELCRRQPAVMDQGMLEDLTEYRKSKDKGVIAAARGLLALFRDVNPGLLKRRERVRRLEPFPSLVSW